MPMTIQHYVGHYGCCTCSLILRDANWRSL